MKWSVNEYWWLIFLIWNGIMGDALMQILSNLDRSVATTWQSLSKRSAQLTPNQWRKFCMIVIGWDVDIYARIWSFLHAQNEISQLNFHALSSSSSFVHLYSNCLIFFLCNYFVTVNFVSIECCILASTMYFNLKQSYKALETNLAMYATNWSVFIIFVQLFYSFVYFCTNH